MYPRDIRARKGKPCNADLHGIGDMAKAYNVTLRALRFYEERGLIASSRFGASRFYDSAARARLQMILKGKQLGFTLAEICEMIATRSGEASPVYELSLGPEQVQAQIDMLKRQQANIERAIYELRETHDRLSSAATAGDVADAQHSVAAE